jgi:hypothetical protein
MKSVCLSCAVSSLSVEIHGPVESCHRVKHMVLHDHRAATRLTKQLVPKRTTASSKPTGTILFLFHHLNRNSSVVSVAGQFQYLRNSDYIVRSNAVWAPPKVTRSADYLPTVTSSSEHICLYPNAELLKLVDALPSTFRCVDKSSTHRHKRRNTWRRSVSVKVMNVDQTEISKHDKRKLKKRVPVVVVF